MPHTEDSIITQKAGHVCGRRAAYTVETEANRLLAGPFGYSTADALIGQVREGDDVVCPEIMKMFA